MAKIFLTGMSAHQASASSNSRSLNYAGVVYKVLTDAENDVIWGDPRFDLTKEDMDEYDVVLIGISPLTSLISNRVYGALRLINMLWGQDKLRLFIDTPNSKQVPISIKALYTNQEQLTKPFYSYRKDYKLVCTSAAAKKEVVDGLSKLHNLPWPTTLYPGLPWGAHDKLSEILPPNIANSAVPTTFDSYFIQDPLESVVKTNKWCVNDVENRDAKKLMLTLSLPTEKLKSGRSATDSDVFTQIAGCSFVFISPVKNDGSWWTYKYIQALNAATPVYTDWKETASLGPSWSYLAPTIEAMTAEERSTLAANQRAAYISAIPEKEKALQALEISLGISKRKE